MRYSLPLVAAMTLLTFLASGDLRQADALTVEGAIPVGARPQTVAVNPVTHRVYVAHDTNLPSNSFVTVIDSLTNSVVTTIGVGKSASSIAVNTVTNRVYVANFDSNSVSVIDGTCNCVIASPAAGPGAPRSVAVDESSNRFFVGTNDGGWNGQFIAYNGATNGAICSANFTRILQGLVANPNTGRVYASMASGQDQGDRGAIVDGSNCGILFNNVGTCTPWSMQLVYNPTDNRFYGTTWGGSKIGGYSPDTGAVETCIGLPGVGSGWGTGLNQASQILYGGFGLGVTTRFYSVDIQTQISSFVDTGLEMNGIGVDPETCQIYVANHNNNQIWIASDDFGNDCDGAAAASDNCPAVANPGQEDGDIDGVGDACDNCPAEPNPGQENVVHSLTPAGDHCEDPDGDLIQDISDVCPDDSDNDSDGDGICNGSGFQPPKTGGNDNCPTTPNPGQANADDDQWGDACETVDCVNQFTPWATPAGDSDCDGSTDADELLFGTDPDDACSDTPTMYDERGSGFGEPEPAWAFDINDDQLADFGDILAFAPHFNKTFPDPAYSARFDFFIDQTVDFGDVLQYVAYFNKDCTDYFAP